MGRGEYIPQMNKELLEELVKLGIIGVEEEEEEDDDDQARKDAEERAEKAEEEARQAREEAEQARRDAEGRVSGAEEDAKRAREEAERAREEAKTRIDELENEIRELSQRLESAEGWNVHQRGELDRLRRDLEEAQREGRDTADQEARIQALETQLTQREADVQRLEALIRNLQFQRGLEQEQAEGQNPAEQAGLIHHLLTQLQEQEVRLRGIEGALREQAESFNQSLGNAIGSAASQIEQNLAEKLGGDLSSGMRGAVSKIAKENAKQIAILNKQIEATQAGLQQLAMQAAQQDGFLKQYLPDILGGIAGGAIHSAATDDGHHHHGPPPTRWTKMRSSMGGKDHEGKKRGIFHTRGSAGRTFTLLFALLTIVVHLLDAFWLNFSFGGFNLWARIAYLTFFAMIGGLLLNDIWKGVKISLAQLLLIVLVGLPFIRNSFQDTWIYTILFVLVVALPLWPMNLLPVMRNWWTVVVFFVLVFYLLFQTFGLFGDFQIGDANPLNAAKIVGGFFTSFIQSGSGFFSDIGTGVKETVVASLDYATGGHYSAMVEDQQNTPVGLYIKRLHLPAEFYFEDEPVYVWADFSGTTFKNLVEVHTSCYTDTPFRAPIQGQTNPTSFEVFAFGSEQVECKFDSLPAGPHLVEFAANFNFETLGTVRYTFVHKETLRNYLKGDANINSELGIDYLVNPIFTPGPVILAMSSEVLLPIGIDESTAQNQRLLTPFGVRLDNLWTRGEIDHVDEYIVVIPEMFKLEDCSPVTDHEILIYNGDYLAEILGEEGGIQGVHSYIISQKNSPRKFNQFSCRLKIAELYGPNDIIPLGQQKADYTFIVHAKYHYNLQRQINVEVLKLDWMDLGRAR